LHNASLGGDCLHRRSVTDAVTRPSCYQVRQKVVPLAARVSLSFGIYVLT